MLIMVDCSLDNTNIKEKLLEVYIKKNKLIKIEEQLLLKNNLDKIPIKLKNILNSIPSDYISKIQRYISIIDLILYGSEENTDYIIGFNWVNLFDILVNNYDIADILIKNKPKEKKLFEMQIYFKKFIDIFNDYFKLMGSNSILFNKMKESEEIEILNISLYTNLSNKTIDILTELNNIDKYEDMITDKVKEFIIPNTFIREQIVKLT